MSIRVQPVIIVIQMVKGMIKMKRLPFMIWLSLTVLNVFAGNPHKKISIPCKSCHIEENWHTMIFNHDSTGFFLEGVHAQVACKDCHDIKDFSKISPGCRTCHLDVHYGKLGNECQRCHKPTNWLDFDVQDVHRNTSFPFVGIHARLDCKVCHQGSLEGEFRMLKSLCIDCHQTEYSQTQNPVHTGLGFSTQCQECHTMFSWIPADFKQHDAYFPIYSGAHNGKWDDCTTCHYQKGNYQEFSCYLNCHEHNQASTDRKHHEVSGYVYDSHACYRCHSGGRGDD